MVSTFCIQKLHKSVMADLSSIILTAFNKQQEEFSISLDTVSDVCSHVAIASPLFP